MAGAGGGFDMFGEDGVEGLGDGTWVEDAWEAVGDGHHATVEDYAFGGEALGDGGGDEGEMVGAEDDGGLDLKGEGVEVGEEGEEMVAEEGGVGGGGGWGGEKGEGGWGGEEGGPGEGEGVEAEVA